MLGAAVALLVASSTAAGAAGPSDVEELPLSPEDLALIEALDRAGTPTAAAGLPEAELAPWTAPHHLRRVAPADRERRDAQLDSGAEPGAGEGRETSGEPSATRPPPDGARLGRAAILESLGRTVAEALETPATLLDGRRAFLTGDTPVLRGLSGHRVALRLDGVSLHHALTSIREATGWGPIDPWFLGDAWIQTGPARSAWSSGGTVDLFSAGPREGPGAGTEVLAGGRSADRSLGVAAAIEGAAGPAAARVSGSFADLHALRAGSDAGEYGGDYRRAGLSARSRLLGRPGDPALIAFGFDFDREIDTPRLEIDTPRVRIDHERSRQLLFTSISAGDRALGLTALGAWQTFGLEQADALRPSLVVRTESVESFEGRLSASAELVPWLTIHAGGGALSSTARIGRGLEAAGDEGSMLEADGFLSLEATSPALRAEVGARYAHGKTELLRAGDSGPASVMISRPLGEARAAAHVAGPLWIEGGLAQRIHLPSVADIELAGASLSPERALTAELGPALVSDAFDLALIGYASWVDNAIEPPESGARDLINLPEVRFLGLESTLAWRVGRFEIDGALALTSGKDLQTDEALNELPGFTGKAAVRYRFAKLNAFLEAAVRGSRPLGRESPADRARYGEPERRLFTFARLGLLAGTDLGAGFRLLLSVDNLLDDAYLTYASRAPGPGADLRAVIIHRFE